MDKEIKKESDGILDELAISFAAKKVTEELTEALKISITKNEELQRKVDDLQWFLSNMNRFPYLWGKTYRKHIKIFMDMNGIQ